MNRRIKKESKRLLRKTFEVGQRFGFDLLPRHFYSEIPDIRQLRKTQAWRYPLSMEGIAVDLDRQLEFIRKCTAGFTTKLPELQVHKRSLVMNGTDEGYGEIEADFLYCFVRSCKPRKIIQIGCGVSTAVCLIASQDEQYTPEIVCIEPYPTKFLRDADKAGTIRLITKKLQDVELDCFRELSAGDLFFVDSSHVVGPAGEVGQIVLNILPRIARGVCVHFHDISFPYDYSPHILSSDLFFHQESALLHAFLCMNERYTISGSFSMLLHLRQKELQKCFPHMQSAEFEDGVMTKSGHNPSSIYLNS